MDALTAMTRALAKHYGEANKHDATRLINYLGDEGFDLVEGFSARVNRALAECKKVHVLTGARAD